MKTPSRTFTYVALTVVATVAVLSLRAFAMGSSQETPAHKKFRITKQITCAQPGPDGYCQLTKGQGDFDAALIALEKGHGSHDIMFLCTAKDHPVKYDPHGKDAAHGHPCQCQLRTVKVTKYEGANIAAADASAANDPNAIQHLYSNNEADIDAVLACFKP